jgi:hypothetical protein
VVARIIIVAMTGNVGMGAADVVVMTTVATVDPTGGTGPVRHPAVIMMTVVRARLPVATGKRMVGTKTAVAMTVIASAGVAQTVAESTAMIPGARKERANWVPLEGEENNKWLC